jgi:hypothetical protein
MGHHSLHSYSYRDDPVSGVFERERLAKEREEKRVMGLRKAYDNFLKGACEEGRTAVLRVMDLEKSWNLSIRFDWMMWLLRRQASVKDVADPARTMIRIMQKFVEEVWDEYPEDKRNELMARYAEILKQSMPNPFDPAGKT